MDYREQKAFLKAGKYFFIPNDIFDYNLTPRAFTVLCYLAHVSDNMGECFPSRYTIGKHCHITRSTVDKALKELEENGLIGIEKRFRNNIQTTSSYSLCYIRDKKKTVYNLVADINGILEGDKHRGTKYLDGKK